MCIRDRAKARSWSKDNLLPLKFLIETILIGGATLAIIIGGILPIVLGVLGLIVILIHGHHVIEKPQVEPLL